MLSSTVTVELHVLTLPLLSVTVKVTEWASTLLQSKLVLLKDKEAMPQPSKEPLSTCPVVRDPAPVASSCTVAFWQIAVGFTLSSTVTVKVVVATLALLSVTVKVTELGVPTSAQPNVVLLGTNDAIPQASLEPLSACVPVMVAEPEASS